MIDDPLDPAADSPADSTTESAGNSTERLAFFTDAVVAIAMTLLILPLLENVSDAAAKGLDTQAYLDEYGSQLFAFALSFVIIASFWIGHERLFSHIRYWTGWVLVLNIAWMFTIVFLPVATAMLGSLEEDRLQEVIYIGTMLATSIVMAALNLVTRRTPAIWKHTAGPGPDGLASALALTILFTAALLLAVAIPSINYYGLLLLFLSGPLQTLIAKRL